MKKNKNYIISILCIASVLILLLFVNITIDPAGLFHHDSEGMADLILSGNNVYYSLYNVDDRKIKSRIINKMPDSMEAAAMGSSTVMCVNSDMAMADSFYNLGVSDADLYDMLAQFGMMDHYKKHCSRIILAIDPRFLTEDFGKNAKSTPYSGWSDYFLSVLSGKEPGLPDIPHHTDLNVRFRQSLSLSYFQNSIDLFKSKGTDCIFNRYGIMDSDYEGVHMMKDASWVYAKTYQMNTASDVKADAESYDIETRFAKDAHISENGKKVLKELLEHSEKNDTVIDIFFCPVAPSLYSRLDNDEYPVLDETEQYVKELAKTFSINVIGSFDPSPYKLSDDDFYDCRHMRIESLIKTFDFSQH